MMSRHRRSETAHLSMKAGSQGGCPTENPQARIASGAPSKSDVPGGIGMTSVSYTHLTLPTTPYV